MISYFMLGTNQFDRSVAFYDALMTAMGAQKVAATERLAAWGFGIGTPLFIVCKPYNGHPATFGNGTMISFDAPSPDKVDGWYAKARALGATDEGPPGMRGPSLYVAYCRDLDGNKFNFIHYLPAALAGDAAGTEPQT
jgi:catechol 2,3-dioxygenase-like lactoylglutathione lyase family enzyme